MSLSVKKKVAIVYDRVNKFGGAERFLGSILNLFPDAPIYTLVWDKNSSGWARGHKVVPTFFNYFPFLRSRHELLAPFAPLAFETLDLSQFDLIISVTSADAKSVITRPGQVHICICLTPTRYLWSMYNTYKQDLKMRLIPKFVLNYLRFVDLITSTRPDHYLSISKEVQKRVKKYYQRSSQVIYPPVEDMFFIKKPVPGNKRDYFLTVGRLVPYKMIDLVIDCFNKTNEKLIVVGTGSELARLKRLASKNVKFVGEASDKELINYYSHAKAVIYPQLEDFGLVPLESQAAGTPVIAFNKGGSTETVIHGKTGILFQEQTVPALTKALEDFESAKINYQDCINNAKKFSKKKFSQDLKKYLYKKLNNLVNSTT